MRFRTIGASPNGKFFAEIECVALGSVKSVRQLLEPTLRTSTVYAKAGCEANATVKAHTLVGSGSLTISTC